jgi:hypothetical protein
MMNQIKALLFAAGAALLSTGCYATAGTSGVAYAEVDEAPVVIDVATYPHTYYEGRNVYFYQDRWYYQDGARWSYYRSEPPALYRQRGYVQRAPAARFEHGHYAPPAHYEHHNDYGHQDRARPVRRHVEPVRVPARPVVRPAPRHKR